MPKELVDEYALKRYCHCVYLITHMAFGGRISRAKLPVMENSRSYPLWAFKPCRHVPAQGQWQRTAVLKRGAIHAVKDGGLKDTISHRFYLIQLQYFPWDSGGVRRL